MPYTRGQVHQLSASGSFAVSQPIGLLVNLAGDFSRFGRLATSPDEYLGMGWLRYGNADGWEPDQPLRFASGLYYPIPDGMTQCSVTLTSPLTASVYELQTVPPPSNSLAPWDRSPVLWQASYYNNLPLNGGTGYIINYTVPAGRILCLEHFEVTLLRTGVPTSPYTIQAAGQINSVSVILADMRLGPVGSIVSDKLQAGPLYLLAGTTVTANAYNYETSGSAVLIATASGFTFLV